MKITNVNPPVFAPGIAITPNKSVQNINATGYGERNNTSPQQRTTAQVLHQMPNISFAGRRNYGHDDLSPYDNYAGPRPPQIEIDKYHLSCQVEQDIEDENYLSAINGKIELAKICKRQGAENDAYLLEESIRRLYKDLPRYQRSAAKQNIAGYNRNMAQYIDEDIKRY